MLDVRGSVSLSVIVHYVVSRRGHVVSAKVWHGGFFLLGLLASVTCIEHILILGLSFSSALP